MEKESITKVNNNRKRSNDESYELLNAYVVWILFGRICTSVRRCQVEELVNTFKILIFSVECR